MSWLSIVIGKFGTISQALVIANKARQRFTEYAKSDSYTSLYELVCQFSERQDLTGSQKLDLVLTTLRSDVELYGKFCIKAAIELILGELENNKQ